MSTTSFGEAAARTAAVWLGNTSSAASAAAAANRAFTCGCSWCAARLPRGLVGRRLHVLHRFAGRALRRERTFGCVRFEPRDLGIELEQLMAQLRPAMRLARRHIQMRRDAEALERAVHLDRL